jgi:NTF2 fold immunity protein of polymorphic toxin system component
MQARGLLVTCVFLLAAFLTVAQGHLPKSGAVPDSKTATKIAEAVLIPAYGEATIKEERPFTATLKGDVWTVAGTLHCKDTNGRAVSGNLCDGGVAVVQLSRSDGRILSITHYK